ncbi:hypothetical protein ABZP36_027505 [Zizania latifolia]
MPPKKAQPSKAELAKKQKVVEDKTFGLKNKNKSKNVQKYVQAVQQAVQPKPDPTKTAAKAREDAQIEAKKKEEEKAREKELNDLFKVAVSQPKVPVGMVSSPLLSLVSHSLVYAPLIRHVQIDLGAGRSPCYAYVCKYFLDAVEKKQYGWFWVCPNGGKDCHYRHALPPGYVLKSQMKALLEEESEKIAIEDEIEDQRKKVKTTTPMTTELFMEWKRKKIEEREAGLAALRADRAKNDRMSGRELFMADSSVFVDDAEAYEVYERHEESEANEESSKKNHDERPSSSTSIGKEVEEPDDDEDIDIDDDLDIDELNELEASLSRTSIQIREPGEGTSS